jgi:hypothetical protein
MRNGREMGGRRRGWAPTAALLAAFALLVQALAPAAAMAAQARGGDPGMTICTGAGVETISGKGGASHKGFAGLPCQDCLSVAQATIATPALAVTPVVHAASPIARPPAVRTTFRMARAPPRPPGQGPPNPIA